MDDQVPAGAEEDREGRRAREFARRTRTVDDVAIECRECGQTYIGSIWQGIIEKTAEGHLPIGCCEPCCDKDEASKKAFEKTFHGVSRRGKSEAPDLELPTMTDEVQEHLGFDTNQERDDDERDEYWK